MYNPNCEPVVPALIHTSPPPVFIEAFKSKALPLVPTPPPMLPPSPTVKPFQVDVPLSASDPPIQTSPP